MSEEVYYLRVGDEQRGPYTLRHIDHQLNSGLIPETALYVREGMEQWQPVTDLVVMRRPRKRWKPSVGFAIMAVVLLVAARIFAPSIVERWREMAQYDFTPKAAYWSARDAVRQQALPAGALVKFASFGSSHSALDGNARSAKVQLRGEVLGADGQMATQRWRVSMQYDERARRWHASEVQPAP